MISCLDIYIKQNNNNLSATIAQHVENMNVSVNAVDRLNVSLTMVCTVGKDSYIRIDKDVVWLTHDSIEKLLVKSNTRWEIV